MPHLRLELIVPPKAHLGDTVEITIRVRNAGKRPADLELSGRPVAFDVIIRGPDGTEVWRRLGQGAIAAALMVLRLEPGEAHEFSLRWAEVDNAGSQVRPGRYTVRGMVPIDGRNRMTAERPLLIES